MIEIILFSILLAWDQCPPEVTEIRIYDGVESRVYDNYESTAGNPSTHELIKCGMRGSHIYMAATAVNAEGRESVYSDEVDMAIPPLSIEEFASEFGGTNACDADYDQDGDADGADLLRLLQE